MLRRHSQTGLEKSISEIPLFASCDVRELRAVAGMVKEVEFPAGHAICREGETGVGMHVVTEGKVRVDVAGQTREVMGPGSFFGEIALLDGGPRAATVTAETDVRTLSLAAWDFKVALESHPGLARKMLAEVCARLRRANADLTH